MTKAIHAIKNDNMPIREDAVKYDIPYATLKKHLIKNATEQVTSSK